MARNYDAIQSAQHPVPLPTSDIKHTVRCEMNSLIAEYDKQEANRGSIRHECFLVGCIVAISSE